MEEKKKENNMKRLPKKKKERKIKTLDFLFFIWDLSIICSLIWDLGSIYRYMVFTKIENPDFSLFFNFCMC